MPRAAEVDTQFPSASRPVPPPYLLHAKHDATRAPRFWHTAKGLFNQLIRTSTLEGDAKNTPLVPPAEERYKHARRSTSTPALRAIANTSSSNLRREMTNNPSPSLPSLFSTKCSFDQSPQKLKSKTSAPSLAVRRLAISSPSLPKPLDSLGAPHPKLTYKLSPIPSPVGSTFSWKTPGPQPTSQSQLAQTDGISSTISDSCNETRSVRRRTKSAPGAKFGRCSLFSRVLPVDQNPATPSIELSTNHSWYHLTHHCVSWFYYFMHRSSSLAHADSPHSFTSVKRKPVPRHLYMDPPEHDTSAPCKFSFANDFGALSPLTDDEVDAIRSFLRCHATGHRARQRRKAVKLRSSHSRDTSVASCSYNMHTQFLESYATDDDDVFSIDYSEDDADEESHLPMSASETHSMATAPTSFRELATADARIPCDGEMESRPSLPAEWVNHGNTEDMSETSKLSREEGNAQSGEIDSDTLEDASNRTPVAGPLRSSSLYYRLSSDYAQQSDDDDGLSYLHASRQPLIPRMISSDSESDRPISCSTPSLSTSTSTGRSAFASGIVLVIILPEHFAYFDKFAYEYIAPYTEGSVTRLECASPRTQRGCAMKCNNSFDALKTDLTSLQIRKTSASDARSSANLASLVLKPALQINARRAGESRFVQLPSPTDVVEKTCLPQTSVNMQRAAACGASADEALPESVKSFMNLTPNEPKPKRTRVKLRQLFSRSNLKSATG
ncbi:hypothetical protein ACEPAI_3267 [Sanghuangporus weigelae]